jgi:hypothetical protein
MSVTSRQRASHAGHAQVDDVAVAQVDLGRRARALDHDDVVLGPQASSAPREPRPDVVAALAPGHAREGGVDLPEQHDLAVRVALGLEQHRVHAHLGLGARGEGLEVLRAADLADRRRRRARCCSCSAP